MRLKFASLAGVGLALLSGFSATAANLDLLFGDNYAGSSPSSSIKPWIEATFQDIAPGRVRLTVANNNLAADENVGRVWFNLNSDLNPQNLRFDQFQGTGRFDKPRVWTGRDLFNANGAGRFDLQLQFAHGGRSANRFGAGETVTFEIFGIPGLTSADFKFLSAGTPAQGPFLGAANIQRIGQNKVRGWIDPGGVVPWSVPEPGTAAFGLMAAAAWFLRRLARSRR